MKFFQGHWPSVPVMPGVLVIEVMAQVGALLVFHDIEEAEQGSSDQRAFLLGIDRARFRRNVVPGDQIVVEAELMYFRSNTCKIKAVANIDQSVAAEAELLFGLSSEK